MGGIPDISINNNITHLETMLKDTFITHGVLTLSNWGGLEIQISECGEGARVRDNYGGEKRNKTRWQQIKYDRQGEPFIIHHRRKYHISEFMRV